MAKYIDKEKLMEDLSQALVWCVERQEEGTGTSLGDLFNHMMSIVHDQEECGPFIDIVQAVKTLRELEAEEANYRFDFNNGKAICVEIREVE